MTERQKIELKVYGTLSALGLAFLGGLAVTTPSRSEIICEEPLRAVRVAEAGLRASDILSEQGMQDSSYMTKLRERDCQEALEWASINGCDVPLIEGQRCR